MALRMRRVLRPPHPLQPCRTPCRCASRAVGHGADQPLPVAIIGGGPVGLTLGLLLSKLGVRTTVLERLPTPSSHPQAHFINVRSMEVFRSLLDRDGRSVAEAITALARPREEWSRFLYSAGPVLGGVSLGATHHFPPETLAAIRGQSPELPTHLPQHQLVPLLLDAIAHRPAHTAPCDVRWGAQCTSIAQRAEGGVTMGLDDGSSLAARRVVCCDGANSPSREQLGLPLRPLDPMEQPMVNVHFTSATLARALIETDTAAMLYFVYAPDVIGVVVAHNLGTGEFALQLPSFGPALTPDELAARYTPSVCARLVRLATVGADHPQGEVASDIEVLSVAGWTMRAAVAPRWVAGDAILCGDSAHVFPPAGGFGMNTGIQDAHALAWRLALLERQDSGGGELLAGYERERRQVSEENAALSLRNYRGVAELSASLGCNPAHAELAASIASTVLPPSVFGGGLARTVVEGAVGLAAQGVLSGAALASPLALTCRPRLANSLRRHWQCRGMLPLLRLARFSWHLQQF